MLKGHWSKNAIDTPPDLSELQSEGYPTSGNARTGLPPTQPGAAWFYLMDQMRLSVIEAAGNAQDDPTDVQLFYKSLLKIVVKGIEDGAITEAMLKDRSVTSAKLAEQIDLAAGGGVKLLIKGFDQDTLQSTVLGKNELAVNLTTYGLYIGDGTTPGGHLVGGETMQQVQAITEILALQSKAIAQLGATNDPFPSVQEA